MNATFKKFTLTQKLGIAAAIAFFMLLTRGSHVLTTVSLPDASLVLFLLGGLFLGRAAWFLVFFVLGSVIDFGVAALDPWQGFCLTDGYWGLIPAYGAMWLGGRWLAGRADAFAPLAYGITALITTLTAFVISTQTYYLFSGRFPNNGVLETIQYGWDYFPGYVGFAALYFAIVWGVARIVRHFRIAHTAEA
ncbi:hypothetical protein MTYP_02073 [Methylophilaceae bacterium]|nr:hypothetical protein MTYP_02073 [Methylophilaceae bacterium]